MLIDQLFETEFATRKAIWSKRGDKITRREVDVTPDGAVSARTKIEVKDADK